MEKYCYNCMNIKNSDNICEHCGHGTITDSYAHHLPLGTVLNKRYMIGHAIGEGGFGITYIARDLNLDMIIAVKEYYPNGYANRNNEASLEVTVTGNSNEDFFTKGKEKFIKEARVLAKFSGNKNIVDVRDYFEDNNTAYIVMEYVDGMTLKDYLKSNGKFEAEDIFKRLVPLCEALKKVHKSHLIHRDISPDNIMILKNGSLKLMDFGAARDVNFEDKKSLSIVLKPGYAPEEQYRSKGKQGPWTDIYAICATAYKCITGVTPDDSMERVFSDELKRPSELGIDIPTKLEDVLMKGLSIYQKDRFQNIDEFLLAFNDKKNDDVITMNINSSSGTSGKDDDDKTEYYDDDKTEYYDDDNTERQEDDDKTEHYDESEEEILIDKEKPYSNYSSKNKKENRQLKKEKTVEKKDNKTNYNHKKSKKGIIIGAAVMVAIIISIIFAVMSCTNNKVKVPNTVGLTESKAMDALKKAGLKEKAKYVYSKSVNLGIVISQSIKEGTEIEKESIVTLKVSKGEEIKVPNVVGKTKDEAESLLTEKGLTLKIEKESFSNKVNKGLVISQNPASSTTIDKGTIVSVVISAGEKLYKVPNVKNMPEDKAKKIIHNANLKVSVQTEYNDSVKKGLVIKQSVSSGKKVKKNTKVTITVSKGSQPVQQSVTQENNSSSNIPSKTNSSSSSNRSTVSSDDYDDYEIG